MKVWIRVRRLECPVLTGDKKQEKGMRVGTELFHRV